jgi:hypothetical protein
MKQKKSLRSEALSIKVKVDKSLDKLSGKNLFPKKLEIANEILSKTKFINEK